MRADDSLMSGGKGRRGRLAVVAGLLVAGSVIVAPAATLAAVDDPTTTAEAPADAAPESPAAAAPAPEPAAEDVVAPLAAAACTPAAGFTDCVAYTFEGTDQSFVVPDGVTSMQIQSWGAGAGGSSAPQLAIGAPGGSGGYVEGEVAVTPGDEFVVVTGGGGGADGAPGGSPICDRAYGFGGACTPEVPPPAGNGDHFNGGGGGGLSGLFTGAAPVTATDQGRALLVAGGGGAGEGTNATTCATLGVSVSASGGAGGNSLSGGMPTMQGVDGVFNATRVATDSTGGGGGFAGGNATNRLSSHPCVFGANGGSNFIAATGVTDPVDLPGTEAASSPSQTVNNPPSTDDPNYLAGVGVGQLALNTAGGNGLVVIQYNLEEVPPPPLTCAAEPIGYLFQTPGDGAPTDVFAVNLVTGSAPLVAEDIATQLNAVGYNPVDDYMYAFSAGVGFVRTGQDYAVQDLGLPSNWTTFPGMPSELSTGAALGEFTPDGHYWIAVVTGPEQAFAWAEIDLSDPASPTYMQVVAAGTTAPVGPPTGNISNLGADWSYNVDDGNLYLVSRNTPPTANDFELTRFNTATHELETAADLGVLTNLVDLGSPIGFGATYADSDGFMYASDNITGGIWRVDMSAGTAAFFVDGPASDGNDGARCYDAPIPIDLGDAPDTFGTLLAADGPRHAVPGYDPDTNTAPVMLGPSIDAETDGQPNATADGDDTTDAADEDGVVFNAALGYPNPTLRTGLDPVSLQPVENALDVTASADGFVSVWVDWNQDGDFGDADEQVAAAQAVTAGANQVTFAQGTNPPGIQTYVRVRYSTDAASIGTPTGPAPDGEVEDYQVLVERLTLPDTCAVSDVEHYAFTFSPPVATAGTGGVGSRARYANVTVVNGVPVDMVVQVVAGAMNATIVPPNGLGVGGGASGFGADDARFQINQDATLRYSFYEAGTNNPVAINGVFTGNDMDGSTIIERAIFDPADLASYGVSQGSTVVIAQGGGQIWFAGTATSNGNVESRFQVVIEGESTFDVQWQGGAGSGFGFDGDGDVGIQPVGCEDYGDAPDTYGTTSAANGANHTIAPGVFLGSEIDFDPDGQPTAAADGDDATNLADEDGVAFNAALGYPTPTLRTGLDPSSQQPLTNTLDVTVSADGFASVWVDWNMDGDFLDADEQVANAQAVTAGANQLTFAQGTNPPGIQTYVRVRYSTDAASIATPTGPAPDGEVEDYRVLVERLVPPDTCVATGNEYYAFTFTTVADQIGTGAVGSTARYPNVTVIGGVAVDVVAEVVAGTLSPSTFTQPNGFGIQPGLDDAGWNILNDATIRYSFVEAGTTNPVGINGVFNVNDMDWFASGREIGTFDAADLAGYAVTQGSAVDIQDSGGQVSFLANGIWNGDPESRFQFVLEGIDTFDVRWQGAANSGFSFDGDGDLGIQPPACEDFGDAPDTYGTLLADDGARHTIVDGLFLGSEIDFDPDGQPTPDADGDDIDRLADEDGVTTPITLRTGQATTVSVSATNNTTEDATLAGWIDLDGSGTFDAGELQTITVPASSGTASYDLTFPAGTATADTYARFRLFPGGTDPADILPTGPASAGEVEDYPVTVEVEPPPVVCPAGSVLIPVEIIQNPSYESRTQDFVNTSANSINYAEFWHDSHPTGGQYHVFSPTFDSGPDPATMPIRAGSQGYGFMGGHSQGGLGEGATNTLAEPLVPGDTYVGYFSMAAGGYNRQGDGLMEFFGTSDPAVGHLPNPAVVVPTATNIESLYQTPVVNFPGVGVTPTWEQTTFTLQPTQAWDFLRVEVRNADPAGDAAGVPGQVWMNFDDFHMFRCEPQLDKDVIGLVPNGDGTYTVSYQLTVNRTDTADGVYDLRDTLQFGTGFTPVGLPTVTPPAGVQVTVNPGYDGIGDTLIADDVAITAGASHVYRVDVIVEIDETVVTFEGSDCDLGTGESGTGLLNEASLEIDGETITDQDCPDPPGTPVVDKQVTAGPTPSPTEDGVFTVEYTITATNASAGAGEYDLVDALHYGAGVTVRTASIAAAAGSPTPNASWDGQTDTVVVTDQAIAGGTAAAPTVHTYVVTVELEVAPGLTPEAADCTQGPGETGTGLLNEATMNVNGEDSEAEACAPLPLIDIDKAAGTPTPLGNGEYDVVYTLTVTNSGEGAGEYDLTDTFRFGAGITVVGTPATANTAPGGIVTNPAFDGTTDTAVASDVPIAGAPAGGPPVTHTYTVTVRVNIPADIDPAALECSTTPGTDGGLNNEAAVSDGTGSKTDEDCPPVTRTVFDKELVSVTPNGDGTSTVSYTLTVTQAGGDGQYDLADTLRYGSSVSVVSAAVTSTTPAGLPVEASWNGTTSTQVATGVAIAAGDTHVYNVDVVVTIDEATTTTENSDCTVTTSETGTGLSNDASVTVNGETIADTDCEGFGATNIAKAVTAGPTATATPGEYSVEYTITATNVGSADDLYDLTDTLHYGAGTNITSQAITTAPAGVTPNAAWNGQSNVEIVTGQALATGATHQYVVTVTFTVDAAVITPETGDCDPATAGPNTGLLNTATVTVNGESRDGEACEETPATTFTKELVSTTPLTGDQYELTYELTVTRVSGGDATYDLDDELRLTPAVTVISADVPTAPAGVTPSPTWDGDTDIRIATGVALTEATPHIYEVVVVVEVDAAAVTPSNSDCELTAGEAGTGAMNTATVTVTDEHPIDGETCEDFPATIIHKDVTSGPTAVGGGVYEVVYTITATNSGTAADTYDVEDTPKYGAGVTITDTVAANVTPGDIVVRADWDGAGQPFIVEDESIEPATSHVYTATVRFTVDPGIADTALDCTLDPGESGTGLLNTATVTVPNATRDAEACVEAPVTRFDKTLDSVVDQGGGQSLATYTLTVSQFGADDVYDLVDTLHFGAAVTVQGTAVTSAPAGVTPNGAWNGISDPVVAADVPIAAGTVHTYTVTVLVAVDEPLVTPGNSDCTIDDGEAGSGLSNTAAAVVNDVSIEDDACEVFPATVIRKDIASGPTAVGGGAYDIVYTITVTDNGSADDVYDLDDTLRLGAGVNVVSAAIANTTPGGIATNPAWDGRGAVDVVDDVPIATGVSHVYTAMVRFTADPGITPEAADCTIADGEGGSGLSNTATITTGNGETHTADRCTPTPATRFDKVLVSTVPNGDGTYTITYDLTITRTGSGAPYRLTDTLRYGAGSTVNSVAVTATTPAGLPVNGAWNGVGDTVVADNVAIADGETHTYRVAVIATVDPDTTPGGAGDCTLDGGESGTGFTNTAAVTTNDVTIEDTACDPYVAVQVTKDITAGPTDLGNGQQQVTYSITATNTGGAGTYNLTDTLTYGGGVSVVGATVGNATPGGIATNPGWNGQSDTTVVAGQAIGAGETHTYTAIITITIAEGITQSQGDCTMDAGEAGTGLLNRAQVNSNGQTDDDEACVNVPLIVTPPPTPPPPPPSEPPTEPQPPGELPATGGNSAPILQIALLVVAAGLGALVLARRRRRAATR